MALVVARNIPGGAGARPRWWIAGGEGIGRGILDWIVEQFANREVIVSSSEDVEIDQTLVKLGCTKVHREDVLLGIGLETAQEGRPLSDCEALGLYPTI